MKIKYSFTNEGSYLFYKITGEFDISEFFSYPIIIKTECEREKVYKVLIDALDVVGTDVSTVDRFLIGEVIARVLGSKIKLAATWPEKDIDKLAETVALNRGGNICVLGDIEAAKRWLLDSK